MADKLTDSDLTKGLDTNSNGRGLNAAKHSFADIQNHSFSKALYWKFVLGFDQLKSKIINSTIYEFEIGNAFNLLPIFMGIGITLYFVAPSEPNLTALILAFCFFVIIAKIIKRIGPLYLSFAVMSSVLCGMLVSKISVIYNHTPMIERQITANFEGVVLAVDKNRRGSPRYIIQVRKIGELPKKYTPEKVRVSAAAKHQTFSPGDQIKGLVRLQPVSGPVYPGGYDFSYFAWFKGIGGSGFFMGTPIKTGVLEQPDIYQKLRIGTNNFRLAVENRILKALPNEYGAIAVALVTGNKSGIPEHIQSSLRNTGLAHILAISGLHMALVTLTVIWLVRFILARIHAVSLYYSVKKIAVCSGFLTSTGYLILSGAGIATQRAWIMISVMLLASLMDRRAITMRNVAISALIILCISPESLFMPGFQMSFAAVTALVSGYEVINNRKRLKAEDEIIKSRDNVLWHSIKLFFKYFGGIALTSLIAGSATGFIAAYHFNQMAPLGLLANVMAMPFVTIIVMPFVLASVLLMPYGFEALALAPVAFGIENVISISKLVEGYSPSTHTGLLPQFSIVLFAIFLSVLMILKTKLRFLSFGILLFIPILWVDTKVPDILIAENGRLIAVKTEEDKLALVNSRSSGFVSEIWKKAWAPDGYANLEIDKEQCNRERCIHEMPNGKELHIVYNPDLIKQSCLNADIFIAPRLWWINCYDRKPELILKRYDFEQNGMHAIYFDANYTDESTENSGYRIETGLQSKGRPWNRNVRPIDQARAEEKILLDKE